MRVPFANEPLTDFSQLPAHRAFEAALARIDAEDDREYPLVIGGEPVWSGEWIDSADPCASGSPGLNLNDNFAAQFFRRSDSFVGS